MIQQKQLYVSFAESISGSYMMLTDDAELVTVELYHYWESCLTFWYHVEGSGALSVYYRQNGDDTKVLQLTSECVLLLKKDFIAMVAELLGFFLAARVNSLAFTEPVSQLISILTYFVRLAVCTRLPFYTSRKHCHGM